jgi:hypothetical protein
MMKLENIMLNEIHQAPKPTLECSRSIVELRPTVMVMMIVTMGHKCEGGMDRLLRGKRNEKCYTHTHTHTHEDEMKQGNQQTLCKKAKEKNGWMEI